MENASNVKQSISFEQIAPIGSEVEDVIDTVLDWIGAGVEFEDAMKWKRIIDSSDE